MTPRRRILPIFVPHAGCPNQCVFCDQRRISGSLFPASGAQVRRALEELGPGPEVELAFYGGSFTAVDPALQEELLQAAEPYRAPGAGDGYPHIHPAGRGGRSGTGPPGPVGRGNGGAGGPVHGRRGPRPLRTGPHRRRHRPGGGFGKGGGVFPDPSDDDGASPAAGRNRTWRRPGRLADLQPEGMRIYPTVVLRGRSWRRCGAGGSTGNTRWRMRVRSAPGSCRCWRSGGSR